MPVDPEDLLPSAVDPSDLASSQGGASMFGEGMKGLGRGAVNFIRDIGKGLDSGESVPQDMRLKKNPQLELLNQQLNGALAPNPNADSMQRGAGSVGEFLGGALVPGGGLGKVAGSGAASLFPKVSTAAENVARELHEAGVSLAPGMIGGKTSQAMYGIGGKANTNQILQNKNVERFQQMASDATGVAPTGLTYEALQAATKEVADRTYQPLRDLESIYLGSRKMGDYAGSPFQQDLDNILKRYSAVKDSNEIRSTVASFRDREMPADILIERLQQVRNEASAAFKAGGKNAGRAYREIGKAIEDQMERNLPMEGNILNEFRAGRAQIARNHAVEDMLVDKHTGIVDPVKAQKLEKQGVPLDGPLMTIAKAGSKEFRNATQAPTGKAPMFDTADLWMGGGFGLGGLLSGGLPAVVGAATPLARLGMRQGVASKTGQNMMARGLYDQPGLAGMSPEVLQRMMQGGAGLFTPE